MIRTIEKTGTVDRSALAHTVLDPVSTGKTISVDIERYVPGGVIADEGVRIHKCRLDSRLRQGLPRDASGRVILTPMVRATDNLIGAVLEGDPRRVHRAALSFYNTRCKELKRELDKIARVRNARTAMLVGVGHYADDVFVGTSFLDGGISRLQPWEIGLSTGTMAKLGITAGEHVVLSRYPTTRVIVVQVTEITDGSDNVVCLPVGNVLVADEVTSSADLLDGDRDGDQYVIRAVESPESKAELADVFARFWHGAAPQEIDRMVLTWKDHVEKPEHPDQIAFEKILQKSAVGPVTKDWYAAFAYLMNLESAGVDADLSMEDVRQMMTDALESTFDLKHGNNSDPMALHALMLGMKTLDEVSGALADQGMDVERIGKLADLLQGQSVRGAAATNPAFAVAYGDADYNTAQRFVNAAPEYRPLDFIAALIVARHTGSALAADLVFETGRRAKPLAAVFRDRLFPTPAG